MEERGNLSSEGLLGTLFAAGALGLGLIFLLKYMIEKSSGKKGGSRGREGHKGRPPGRHYPSPGAPHAARAPEPEASGDYVVCLVLPARHKALVEELRTLEETKGALEERHAEELKHAALRFWYGRTGQRQEFDQLKRVAERTEDGALDPSLDFVLCLFYLHGSNADFEARTIGRRYDGILSLAGGVREINVSPQISADDLSGLPLTPV